MKKFSQALALVAVTTLFTTAFTSSHHDPRTAQNQASVSDSSIARVVIIGKRMSALEKAQYDATETLTQSGEVEQAGLRIAVK
ncbi:hypothetical protein AAKU67_003094 [Oxalobacteraceae bacterium GrIS 2.11]